MPAAAKNRTSKHLQTPYTRRAKTPKADQSDEEVLTKASTTSNLVEHAAKRIYSLVSWVFSSGEDLSKSVGASASKVIHRDALKRSATSQLEDGLLNGNSIDHDSLLAPDLIPHYLGKTPLAVKARRVSHNKGQAPSFRVPSFDASQFKIPALPSPTVEKSSSPMAKGIAAESSTVPPPRGRSLKSLEISADTQSRRDEDTLQWLSARNLTPEDLASAHLPNDLSEQDLSKVSRIIHDPGFFRRQGLFPPATRPSSPAQDSANYNYRSPSRASAMSVERPGSDRSCHTLQGRRIASRDWQTNSSTGILAAWREICQQQEANAQNISLNVARTTKARSRASSVGSSKQGHLWHDNISFTQNDQADTLRSVPEIDVDVLEAGEKYWGPIRSFPMPRDGEGGGEGNNNAAVTRSNLALVANERRHRRGHSRQASLAKRPRSRANAAQSSVANNHEPRAQTPASVVSSRHGRQRRQSNASRNSDRPRYAQDSKVETTKPQMVNSQVQTGDELMQFMSSERQYIVPEPPSISKERRKRPGCFSALDEDLEELYGPYEEHPVKKTKITEDDEILMRPRYPILVEDEAVKRLRAQQQKDRESALPSPEVGPRSTPALSHTFRNEPNPRTEEPFITNSHVAESRPAAELSVPKFSFGSSDKSTASNHIDNQIKKSLLFDSDSTPTDAPPIDAKNFGSSNNSQKSEKGSQISGISQFPKFDFGHTPQKVPSSSTTFATKENNAPPKFSFGVPATSDASKFETASRPPFVESDQVSVRPNQFAFGTPAVSEKSTTKAQPTFAFDSHQQDADTTIDSEITKSNPIISSDALLGKASSDEQKSKNALSESGIGQAKSTAPLAFGTINHTANTSSAASGAQLEPPALNDTSKLTPSFAFGQVQEPTQNKPAFVFGKTATGSKLDQQGSDQPVFGSGSPSSGITANQMESSAVNPEVSKSMMPSSGTGFNFGKTMEKASSSFGFPTAGPSNEASQKPVFTFGTPAAIAPSSSQDKTPTFGSPAPALPVKAPTFSFGQPKVQQSTSSSQIQSVDGAAVSSMSDVDHAPQTTSNIFGNATSSTKSHGFGGFGAPAASPFALNTPGGTAPPTAAFTFGSGQSNTNSANQDKAPVFGSTAANAGTNVAAESAAPTSGFTFGQSFPTSNAGSSFQFGQAAPTNNASSPFQFNTQTQNTGFNFGTAQTAPNSGFASPALQSPAIQSSTVPGSPAPNPFDLPSTQQGVRKIAPAKSRRKR